MSDVRDEIKNWMIDNNICFMKRAPLHGWSHLDDGQTREVIDSIVVLIRSETRSILFREVELEESKHGNP